MDARPEIQNTGLFAGKSVIFLTLAIVVTPVIFIPLVLDPALFSRALFLSLLNMATLIALLWQSEFRERNIQMLGQAILRPPLFYYGIYILLSLLSFYHAVNLQEFLADWLKYFNYFVFFLLAYAMLSNIPDFPRKLTILVLISTGIILVVGALQVAGVFSFAGMSHETSYIISSLFAHRNIFSEVLLLCLPFCLYAFLVMKGYIRWIGMALAVIIIAFIIILLSKSAWVALALSGAFFFIMMMISVKPGTGQRRQINTLLIIVLLAAATGIMLIIISGGWGLLAKQFYVLENYRFGSSLERIELWKRSLYMFDDYPLLGVGNGNWKIVHPIYGLEGLRSEGGEIFFQRPHNDYLWVLSENGILGFIPWLLVFFSAFIIGIRGIFQGDATDRTFTVLMLTALFSFLVISFFGFPRERIEHNILISFVIAALMLAHPGSAFKRISPPGKWMLFLMIPLLLFSILVFSVRLRSEFFMRKALGYRMQNQHALVVENIDKAENIFTTVDPTSTPLSWYKGSALFNMGNTEEAYLCFEEASRFNPNHIHVLNNLATCYELRKDYKRAESTYLKACQISPHFSEAIVNLYATYFNQGKIDQALELFAKQDSTFQHPKYESYLMAGLHAKIEEVKREAGNEAVISTLQRINLMDEWALKVYRQSIADGQSYGNQLLIESLYVLCEIDRQLSAEECIKLRAKYKII